MQASLLFDGFAKPGFEKVKDTFRASVEAGLQKGGSFAVYYCGQLVVNLWGGYADREARRPWKKDTLSCYFSATKSMAAVCIAHMVDRGLLSYSEKVSTYWPEFAQNGKQAITLEQLVSNQAGLSVLDEPFLISMIRDDRAKLDQLLAAQRPLWTPGQGHGYHPVTFALYLDKLVRLVDPKRRNLSEYFHEEIALPFGIEFFIGLPKELHHRTPRTTFTKWITSYKYDTKDFQGNPEILKKTMQNPLDFRNVKRINNPDVHELPLGSTAGHGTAEAVAKFHGILANGGVHEGRQLLSAGLIRRLQRPIVGGIDKTLGLATMWSLGTEVLVAVEGNNPPQYMFGHGGYGGQFGLADPHYRIGFGYSTSHCDPDLTMTFDPSLQSLYDALYECVHRLENVTDPRKTVALYPEYVKVTGCKL